MNFFILSPYFTIKPTTGYFSDIPELGPPIKRCWKLDTGNWNQSNFHPHEFSFS
jgi:hypothetical protein